MVKTVRLICALATLGWALVASSALAQRVQFASPVESQAAATAPVVTSPPTATFVQPSAPVSPYPSMPAPAATGPQGATLGAPTTPTYTPPQGYAAPGPVAPGAAVQPPPANWDPYATPGTTTAAPLMQQDPCLQSAMPAVTMASMQKFLQHVDFQYDWFAGHNGQDRHEELGINDLELSATFALPLFHNSQTPLLLTPGFAVHYWEGPLSLEPPDPVPDLPPQTYDAYLDAAWNPQITTWLGAELDTRLGVYSDFKSVTNQAIRFTGKGVGVLTFSPSIKMKLGVWYLNRNVVTLLPAGGICWTPNPDVYFNILFPNPKVGKRLTTMGNTEWWIYMSGDYGGGCWQITRENGLSPDPYGTNGMHDTFDYNDIRVALGLEFKTLKQFNGMFEIGGAFDRGVVYRSGLPRAYYPNNTVYLRTGMSY